MNRTVATVEIKEAEVYRSGCTVTARGTVELVAGQNRLVVEGLPLDIDEGSLRLLMPEGVAQGQVSVVRGTLGGGQSEPEREIDRRIDELDRAIQNKELELQSWRDLATKMGGPSALDFLDRLPAKLEELTASLATLRTERLEANREREEVRNKLLCPRLEAVLESAAAGTAPLELTYRCSQAGWRPSFDVLADVSSSGLSLRMKAEVWQETGQDWQGVTLRLSTGSTTVLSELPRFATRYLSKEPPYRPPIATSQPLMMARMSMPMSDAFGSAPAPASAGDTGAFDAPLREVAMPQATVEEQDIATTYELVGTQDVLGTGEPQTLTVATTKLDARYYHYAYPRSAEAAYLVARLESEPAAEVFEQPLAVYLDGSYAGTVRIARTTETDGYELTLGRDDKVRVRRKEDVQRSKSLLGGKLTSEHSTTITVENRRSSGIELVVLEQVPVSRDKEIEVVLRQAGGATHEESTGELRWERTVAAGEQATFACAYAITHAKGVTVYETERTRGLKGFCPSCGAPLEPDATFCRMCGEKVW